jgi:CRP/FNR family cyclic AMP-dependent transcriptional regulator
VKERFEGETGIRVLVDVLREHKIVGGNEALADEIARVGELRDVERNTALMEQNGEDTDCFLILSGTFTILVNGKKVATRGPTDHVGEMAAIQPSQRRSATVVAAEPAVVLRLTEPQLSALGQKYPNVYRAIAKELARRLMQRNLLMTALREKIRVFIISSVEALPIARAVQNAFEHDPFTVVIWTDGVFTVAFGDG